MRVRNRTRVAVSLDDDVDQLLNLLSEQTQLSPAAIVGKMLLAHLPELWEYLTWLEQLPEGPSQLRSRGTHLIHNYGPQTLLQDIAQLDPAYQTEGQRFLEKVYGK